MKINTVGIVAGLAVASAASSAFAFVPWNNAYSTNGIGGNSVISWTGGGSDNGLFGAPTVVADTFFFQANSNFDALASNGGSVITADTLRVTVTAAPGNYFTEVLYFSSGDYQLFGDGASVNVTGSMTVTDALNNSRTDTQPFVTNPAFPIVGNNSEITQGNWSGFAVIDVASFLGGPVTAIDLVFSNSLIAITAPGSNASIVTLPNTQGSFSLQVIPAPASAFALLGLGLVSRRRR